MPLTVVAGAQYGGEGKGLITAYLVQNDRVDLLVKVGGPNSAHSFGVGESMYRVRMLPSGANLCPGAIVYPAGCLINVECLLEEIAALNYRGPILVDPNAGIVDMTIVRDQQADTFYASTGSTLTGTGHASARRALRRLQLARDEPTLKPFLADTAYVIYNALRSNQNVVAEGAQAYGLSNYHGDYPFVSSRDTTAGSILAQMGLGPRCADCIILVMKCFPTRNSGGTGSLPNEIDSLRIASWDHDFNEVGGGTYGQIGTGRRVAFFDIDVVRRACIANTPDMLALTGLDRLQSLLGIQDVAEHYGSIEAFKRSLKERLGVTVALESHGPFIQDVIDNRNHMSNGRPHHLGIYT